MAIAPIDLQTLFTQVDKVGRSQSAQREGQAIAQLMQGVEIERKANEQINQVNETQNTGEGAEKINDNNQKQNHGNAKGGKRKPDDKKNETEENDLTVISDPSLGRRIDISL
ncbi:MAG: hypothetical protein FWC06_03950 [Treponema sp.]|nr:hypothetical protein [Treponema sp.]